MPTMTNVENGSDKIEPSSFLYMFDGPVVKGFGRGSKELGCPTANLQSDVVENVSLPEGIYFGFAQLEYTNQNNDVPVKISPVYMMCCSIGYNPHYGNEKKSLEVHILNKFANDFYGEMLRVAICGYIRTMSKFESLDQLISAINSDISFTRKVLDEEKRFVEVAASTFFLAPGS